MFELKKRKICVGALTDEYVYKISSRYREKRLSFAVLNAQKATFTLFSINTI